MPKKPEKKAEFKKPAPKKVLAPGEPKPMKRKAKRAAEAAAAAALAAGLNVATPPVAAPAVTPELPKPVAPPEPVPPIAPVAPPEPAAAPKAEAAPKPKAARPKKVVPEPVTAEVVAVEPAPLEEVSNLPVFADLGLIEPLARAIAEMGFETPTPIQARAVPLMLAGHDLIGLAQTGTGKTAAFALPVIQKVDASNRATQALILAPTRELAVQVAGGIYDLAKHTGLRIVPVYGGQPIDRQLRALHGGAHIVVGTPGRVQDHLRRGSLSLDQVKICVLDEADEMLALGFLEDMETILAELPEERQLAFFSATMPSRIVSLTKKFLRNPEHVSIESKRRTLETTNQAYYEVARGQKMEALARVLDMETPGPTIVFCRTRQETNDLAEALRLRGYNADALHGDMNQSERERVLRRFRDEQSDLLVATDVAARGLDIDSVTHVINYDIPFDVEQYIHRIGRTGRAGRSGDAITLVDSRERRQLKNIERMIGATIKQMRLPTAADIAARRRDAFKDSLRETLEAGDFDSHIGTVEALSETFDPSEIAAAALHMLWQNKHDGPVETAEELAADGEQPERGMARIYIGLGRQDNLRPGDVVATIANGTGMSGRDIGTIDILDRSSFVEVPMAAADDAMDALRRVKLRGKKAKVQIAKPFEDRR